MNEVEDEVRELLRRRADDLSFPPGVPAALARRVRRRRRASGALAAVVALAVLAGGFAGLHAATAHRDQEPASPPPSSSAAVERRWPGLWPYRTRAAAEAAQIGVDSGRGRWQLDARSVVRAYATRILGWNLVYFDATADTPDPDASGPVSINVFSCRTCQTSLKDIITVQRLLRRDRTGIWIVIADLHPIPWVISPSGPSA